MLITHIICSIFRITTFVVVRMRFIFIVYSIECTKWMCIPPWGVPYIMSCIMSTATNATTNILDIYFHKNSINSNKEEGKKSEWKNNNNRTIEIMKNLRWVNYRLHEKQGIYVNMLSRRQMFTHHNESNNYASDHLFYKVVFHCFFFCFLVSFWCLALF